MAAHSITDDKELQVLVDEEIILIVVADAPCIGGCPEAQIHSHSLTHDLRGDSGVGIITQQHHSITSQTLKKVCRSLLQRPIVIDRPQSPRPDFRRPPMPRAVSTEATISRPVYWLSPTKASSTAWRMATPLAAWSKIRQRSPSTTGSDNSTPRITGPGCKITASSLR